MGWDKAIPELILGFKKKFSNLFQTSLVKIQTHLIRDGGEYSKKPVPLLFLMDIHIYLHNILHSTCQSPKEAQRERVEMKARGGPRHR